MTSAESWQGMVTEAVSSPPTRTSSTWPALRFIVVFFPTELKFWHLVDSLPMPLAGQRASTVPPV